MNLTRWEPARLAHWEPFREMEEMFRRYAPYFASAPLEGRESVEWTPTADICETDQEYVVKAELPAVKKEDVKVTVNDGVLTIEGERKRSKEQRDENEIRVESFHGRFSRSFALPKHVDGSKIRAESQDGVLRVHIPKTAEVSKPKPISIEVK